MANSSYSAALSVTARAKAILKKDIGKASLLLLCLTVLANILSLLFSALFALGAAVASEKSFSLLLLEELMDSMFTTPLGNFCMSYLPIIVANTIVILMAKKMLAFPLQQPLFAKVADKRLAFFGTFATAGMTILGLVGTSLLIGLFSLFGLTVIGPDFSIAESDPVSNVLMLAYACIAAPVMEEMIFRGYLLGRLKRHGKLFAMVISSLLFAMFHGNLIQFCAPFFLGLLLAFLTMESGSLWPAVFAHSFNNIAAFAISYIENETVYYAVYIVYLLLGLVALRCFIKRTAASLRSLKTKDTGYLTAGQKTAAVFSSPCFWIYLIIFIAGVVLLFWAA